MRSGAAIALVTLGVFVVATDASAARSAAGVVVELDRRLAREALALDAALAEQLAADPRLTSIDLAARARFSAEDARARRLVEARAALADGTRLLDELDAASALAQLRKAEELFERGPPVEGSAGLCEALALQAVARWSDGDTAEATNVLTRLFVMSPEHKLDPARAPPELATLAAGLRTRLREEGGTTLELQSRPVPAHVWVDGTYRGVTPLELANVRPGAHHVVMAAPGWELGFARAIAAPGMVAVATLPDAADGASLRERLDALRAAFLTPEGPARAAAPLAAWAQVDELFVAGLSEKGGALELVLHRVARDGHRLALARRAIRGRGEAAREDLAGVVNELLLQELPRAPGGTAAPAAAVAVTTEREKIGDRTWAYVALGAGVVAGVGGIALGLEASDRADAARAIPQVDSADYQSAVSSGKGLAFFADVLFVVSLGGLGVGGWLLLDGPDEAPSPGGATLPSTPEPDPFGDGGAWGRP